MRITINNKEIELKFGFRALMIYEKITETSFVPKGLNEIIMMFYCVILASDNDFDMNFEEFVIWLDENNTVFLEYSKWLTKKLLDQTAKAKLAEDDKNNNELKKD